VLFYYLIEVNKRLLHNIMMHITYDGTRFYGWQKTNLDAVLPSVEYVVQTCLEKIIQHPLQLQAASRTDRGVHAEAQVINFIVQKESLDTERLLISLNSMLPADVRALSCSKAESSFHASLAAKGKEYIYRIYTGPVLLPSLRFTHWHMPAQLDYEKMKASAHSMLGEHDFVAFRNHHVSNEGDNDTVRTIYSIDFHDTCPNFLEIKISGNNFLYKMCRNLVGTLVYVGLGKISPGAVVNILSGGQRKEAGITAPALALSLHKVFYN
jgi:tRNA pseudouridine38-40 synthase